MDIKQMSKCVSVRYAQGYNAVVEDVNKVIEAWKEEMATKCLYDDYKKGIEDAIKSINEK